MKQNIYKQDGMQSISQLIEFIRNKPTDITTVKIDSSTFNLQIPVSDKDVMCMKVIELIGKGGVSKLNRVFSKK